MKLKTHQLSKLLRCLPIISLDVHAMRAYLLLDNYQTKIIKLEQLAKVLKVEIIHDIIHFEDNLEFILSIGDSKKDRELQNCVDELLDILEREY